MIHERTSRRTEFRSSIEVRESRDGGPIKLAGTAVAYSKWTEISPRIDKHPQ